jgi:hypothetical protein
MPVWGIVLELSILGLLFSVAVLVRAFGIFTLKVERDRSLRFIQAAWGWGLIALLLFAMMPAYNALKGVVFSHAYFGGYRHAFTVGFISLMILGVSSKIVPVLGGLSPSQVGTLRATFWLVNVGNAMRVLFQILTDSYTWAYPVMGLSAWVEVTGLAIWAIDLWRAMGRRPWVAASCGNLPVTLDTRVADVVDAYPEAVPVLLQFGFSMITNPLMRQTVARSVTLEQVCRLRRVDAQALVAALRIATQTRHNVAHKGDQLVTISGI